MVSVKMHILLVNILKKYYKDQPTETYQKNKRGRDRQEKPTDWKPRKPDQPKPRERPRKQTKRDQPKPRDQDQEDQQTKPGRVTKKTSRQN